ncbi:MAG TPA: SDR family NAD(P)-dependent oxidoreductase [Chloroflexota bacterium]|jgi:UDP-glucuronate 4-epimerase|nr:SDR family NAD(P)-dependent oxidoreductase [Chloroflexota bacterium]
MSTVLVTGAAGFIGSHTSRALLDDFDLVVGLDNLNDYYDPARKLANIEEINASVRLHQRFKFVRGDIRDHQTVRSLIAENNVSAIVHLAAMAGVRVSIERPELYYDVNVLGTLNLLTAARDAAVGNFVLASTSSVYGRTELIPFVETDRCDQPLSPYAASKRAAELLGFTFHHLYGQNVTALRFFTVYGPRGRPDMMAYKVLTNIFTGAEVPIYNNGQMHRDWTYIDDIVAGVTAAAQKPLGFEIINLGRGEPVLLADFVKRIEELTGRHANLTPAPMPDADVPYTFADTSKAREKLGYEPKISAAEGVERFWHWYETEILNRQ